MKFNNLGLALGMDLIFYTSVAKDLKLKVPKFWRLISAFVEIVGEKLVEDLFTTPPPPQPPPPLPSILNRVKQYAISIFLNLIAIIIIEYLSYVLAREIGI